MSDPLPIKPPTLSEAACYACLFSTLAFVFIATVVIGGRKLFNFDNEAYMVARNSQNGFWLLLSYFASSVGAWVIFAVPEASILGGWISLLGYTLSTVFPLLLLEYVAPALRRNLPKGITFAEFVQERYGTPCTVMFSIFSFFYMFIYLVAELTSANLVCVSLSQITTLSDTFWETDYSAGPQPLAPALATSIVTLVYTGIGGLPVSLYTDRLQGIGVFLLTIIISVAAFSLAHKGGSDRWDQVTSKGVNDDYGQSVYIAVSLIIGVTCANMFHAGMWQRIWSAENNRQVRIALYGASVLMIIVMVLFGIIGFIGFAVFGYNLFDYNGAYVAFLAAPVLVRSELSEGWHALFIILGIAMVASTADSIQSGMMAVLSPGTDAVFGDRLGKKGKAAVNFAIMAAANVPAIIISLSGQSVLMLFLLADLLCAAAVVPLFMGFWSRTHPMAAIAGAVTGIVTVVVTYAIFESTTDEGFDTLVGFGGIFYKSATAAFCLAPFLSGMVTLAISLMTNHHFEGFKATRQGTLPNPNKSAAESATEIAVSADA